jgi:hypothetical protein
MLNKYRAHIFLSDPTWHLGLPVKKRIEKALKA